MNDHDQNLAKAFDGQAPLFEIAPVQSDPIALKRLVSEADLPPDSLVLDAGCGPGLVSAAFLEAGHRVVGVDLSSEMVARAIKRCGNYPGRAKFFQGSLFDPAIESEGPFDAAISRYVIHHVTDPGAFLARQVALLRPAGVAVACDHVADPDASIAAFHARVEVGRDQTHVRNLTGGELVDLFASVGLFSIRLVEEPFTLDFNEWFDRGTPSEAKETVRDWLLNGASIRTFRPKEQDGGAIRIDCVRAIVRGLKSLPFE
jgi:SAM-dependent methyltransferase